MKIPKMPIPKRPTPPRPISEGFSNFIPPQIKITGKAKSEKSTRLNSTICPKESIAWVAVTVGLHALITIAKLAKNM